MQNSILSGCVDLHTHSCFSDGKSRPCELVAMAYRLGLSGIALTDHDTTNGIAEGRYAADALLQAGISFTFVPGIEISAGYDGRDIHILGLFLEDTASLQETLSVYVANRDKRNQNMLDKLCKAGYVMTMNDVINGCTNATITRAHFANALVNKGYACDRADAFDRFIGDRAPFYIPREYMPPEEAIREIHATRGLAVLAHPILYHFPPEKLNALVRQLKEYGLDGIETYYCTYSAAETEHIRSLAARYSLLKTGGSDYHGVNKPGLQLGSGYGSLRVPDTLLTTLMQYKDQQF